MQKRTLKRRKMGGREEVSSDEMNCQASHVPSRPRYCRTTGQCLEPAQSAAFANMTDAVGN
jgi:hypothetical protein